MKILILLAIIFSNLVFAQEAGLQHLLDIDRFEAYIQAWSQTKKGQGKVALADAGAKITPRDVDLLKIDAKKLGDAFNYDELIYEILQKKAPGINASKVDIEWGYNFYKRKLNDSYKIGKPALSDPKPAPVVELKSNKVPHEILDPADASEVLLNVDGYVSGRTTRAVFWEASKSQRKIELHVGSGADFKSDLEMRGAKILGEVKTHGNNYNPIYLVQDPGEKSFHYAVTQISGADRLKHFKMQSSLVRWEMEAGKLAPPPPIQVVGDAVRKLKNEEAALTQILTVLPKADHVLIGQKGAFERTVRSLGKIKVLLQLEKHPESLSALKPEFVKLIEKAKGEEDLVTFVMKYASPIDKAYDASRPLLPKYSIPEVVNPSVYDLDRGSYEVSDYLLEGKDGKPQRWRVFSNVWGDEVLPVAKALKNTSQTDIVYIGTAGALPGSDLKVGDLAIPEKSHDVNGVTREIQARVEPDGAKSISTVTHVSSPFEETHDWLANRKEFAQAVEVETGYLSSVFNGPNDKLSTLLLISDQVGVEGETLAEASSSVRRNAQIRAISTVLNDADVAEPIPTSLEQDKIHKWINEIAPTRDPVSKFQVYKEAEARGLATKDEVQKLLTSEKSFTTKRILSSIDEAEARLAHLLDESIDQGIRPTVSVQGSFLEGRWNPATGPIGVNLEVADPSIHKELESLISKLKKEDKNFAKFLNISFIDTDAHKEWIRLPGFLDSPNGTLLNLYKDSALGFGGLASTETRTGNLKFVEVNPPQKGRAVNSLTFFTPNDETAGLLKGISNNSDKLKSSLLEKINGLNNNGVSKHWQIVLNEVDEIDGGVLASITPDFEDDKLLIKLNITKEGLSNPMVLMEEIIHLDQIAGDSGSQAFVHPYQWAETIANAKAKSPQAMEKLALLELEAAQSSDNYKYLFFGIDGIDEKQVDEYLSARRAHAEKMYQDVSKLAKADLRKRAKEWSKMKTAFDKMEKESVKFNDLVAKNDRKGVRAMLEKYLPWDIMQPSEVHAWREWLEAIERPNLDKTRLVFRGMDGDLTIKGVGGKPGLLSTVLTKNQGNYTRRLRSLATLRERFGIMKGFYEHAPMAKNAPSILVMMSNHAGNPQGSPFLSVSNNSVATGFGARTRVALNIDERRLVPNGMAWMFANERELLVPLVIFPDEVVHFEDVSKEPMVNEYTYKTIDNTEFIKAVEEKIGRPLKPEEMAAIGTGDEFFTSGFRRAKELFMTPETLPVTACTVESGKCDCVFKTLNALLQ